MPPLRPCVVVEKALPKPVVIENPAEKPLFVLVEDGVVLVLNKAPARRRLGWVVEEGTKTYKRNNGLAVLVWVHKKKLSKLIPRHLQFRLHKLPQPRHSKT